MTYQDILKISDLEEKQAKLVEFYIKEIDILNWLNDDSKNKKILFSDRTEYRTGNVLHNLDGPAIEKKSGEKYYYLHGKNVTQKEWETVATTLKRHNTLKRLTE